MKRLLPLLLLSVLFAAGCRTVPPPPAVVIAPDGTVDQQAVVDATALLPAACRPDVIKQMSLAENNAGQFVKAIRDARPGAERECFGFLLANMPERDLKTLSAAFLLENVRLALEARERSPWKKSDPVPDGVFLDAVLPYACVNEARDPWRAEYRRLFAPQVAKCATVEEAVTLLNREVFKQRKVAYHATKRNKPDQSPAESEACGYASCTGLSIMLADACRAAGIPARLAGTPQWNRPEGGNHTWVEVWSGGRWHWLGAFDPGPFDQTWFDEVAAKSDPARPATWIYAACFRRTGLAFPMVWAPGDSGVPAVDVSASYSKGGAAAPLPLALEIPRLASGAVFSAIAVLNGEKCSLSFALGAGGSMECTIRREAGGEPLSCRLYKPGGPFRLRLFPMDADPQAPGRTKVCAFLLDLASDGDHCLGAWSVPAADGTVSGTLAAAP